jgi:hypothetical protein
MESKQRDGPSIYFASAGAPNPELDLYVTPVLVPLLIYRRHSSSVNYSWLGLLAYLIIVGVGAPF